MTLVVGGLERRKHCLNLIFFFKKVNVMHANKQRSRKHRNV